MKPNIGIIGNGHVGSALRRGLERAGYSVRVVGMDSGKVKETADWAEVVILVVPYGAVDEMVRDWAAVFKGRRWLTSPTHSRPTCSWRAAVPRAAPSICSRSCKAHAS